MAPHDTELILKAQQGDFSAFEQLVFRYDKQVLTIAARFVSNSDDAKDIYQEVFLRVYQGLRRFKMQSEFATWLYRITTNVCLTHRSRRKRNAHVSLDGDYEEGDGEAQSHPAARSHDPLPDQHVIDQEIALHVREALTSLSPQQKMVFTLKHYEGLKLREIADAMQCSEGTVKKHLFTATQRMRERLKSIFGEGVSE
ncbi:MAG TPA: sigma-70 family RNA polymerase sigma factor [Bacteroidota bacterium]|nr:sigma-70 family RNA polymerase sigma factor [Bacteroidota bacterium]